MAIKIGSSDPAKLYFGGSEVEKIYYAGNLVYPSASYSNKIYGKTMQSNQTLTIKVNGTSYSVTSDASKNFELDCSNINITSLNQCIYNQSNALEQVVFDVDTSNCTNFSSLVGSCRYAQYIDCSKLDTSKATNLSSIFYNANSAYIIMPSSGFQHASNMTNIQFMFFGCSSVNFQSVDLSSMLDCDNVVSMNGMFRGCSHLANIDFSGVYFDSNNISADNVFGGCDNLGSIKVEGCQTSTINFLLSCLSASGYTFAQSGDYLIKQ